MNREVGRWAHGSMPRCHTRALSYSLLSSPLSLSLYFFPFALLTDSIPSFLIPSLELSMYLVKIMRSLYIYFDAPL